MLCRQQPDPSCFLRRPDVCLAETTVVVQVKYTNPHDLPDHALFFRPPATDITGIRMKERESMLFGSETDDPVVNQLPDPTVVKDCLFLDQIKREKGVW